MDHLHSLVFSEIVYIPSTIHPKGRDRTAKGAPTTATPKKAKTTTSKKQVPLVSLAVLEHSFKLELVAIRPHRGMDLRV